MNRFLRTLVLFILLFASSSFAQEFFNAEAKGLFMELSTGPRFPIGNFSDLYSSGEGFDVTFSYADNQIFPLFLYTKFEYMHFPGNTDLYRNSNYSTIASNVFSVYPGLRFFYPPIIKNVVILMPVMEVGMSYSQFWTLHQFKSDSGLKNYEESRSKFGFHGGIGFSMFLIDVMAYYNYLPEYQHFSFIFRCRIPIFASVK